MARRKRTDETARAEQNEQLDERRQLAPDSALAAARYLTNGERYGLFLIRPSGELLLSNAEARRLCANASKVFHLRRQHLFIQSRAIDEWLETPLKAGEERIFRITDEAAAGSHYRFLVSRTGLRRVGDPIAVLVYDDRRRPQLSPRRLQQLYGLTSSESATAAHLFDGLKPAETAAARHLAISTIRTHIKKIFAKCGVRSQVGLIRLLALGPGIE